MTPQILLNHLQATLPSAILYVDLSRVKAHIDTCCATGQESLAEAVAADPGEVLRLVNNIRLLDANDVAVHMFGFDRRDTIRQRFHTVFCGKSLSHLLKLCAALCAGCREFRCDMQMQNVMKEPLLTRHHWSILPGCEPDWSMLQVIMSMVADEPAGNTGGDESRYRSIVDDHTDFVVCWEPQTDAILFANPCYRNYVGNKAEITGNATFYTAIVDADAATMRMRIAALTPDDPVVRLECRVAIRSGPARWLEWTSRAIFDDHGQVREIQAVGHDITVDRQIRKALVESERFHRLVLENIADSVFITGAQGHFVFVCPNVHVIFGHTQNDVQAMANIRELVGPGLFEEHGRTLPPEASNLELEITDKSGNSHIVLTNIRGVSIRDGTRLVTCHDITTLRSMERMVLTIAESEKQKVAQDLHDLVGQYLFGAALVCDKLRTKLADSSESALQDLDRLTNLLDIVIRITRDLNQIIYPADVKPEDLIRMLEDLCRRMESLFEVRCTLQADPDIDLQGEAVIHLYRITQEAMTNAIKHGQADTIAISLATTSQGLVLSVVDDGRGIDSAPTRTAGLGLKIMRERAKLIGGDFKISQATNGGATVIVTRQNSRN